MGMSETEFLAEAERVLGAIESAVEEAVNADIDATRAGNVLTLELSDGSRVVINSQTPMRQIWVAARSGGFHYEWRDGAWLDTRDGSELFTALSRVLSDQGGVALEMRAV